MATFRKRGSKWHVQVRRTGHPTMTRSFLHKADAEVWARKIERQLDSGDVVTNHQILRSLTVRSLLERYEGSITPHKRGASAEVYRLRTIKAHRIASCSLASLSPGQVSRFRDDRLKQVMPGTVRRELGVLRHCIEVARREWDIALPINPVTQIQMPSPGKARERRLTSEEYSALIEGCACSRREYLLPIIILAIETAMRRGELLAMRWEDICLNEQLVCIPVTKNGYERTIPLTARATDVLKTLEGIEGNVFSVSANAFQLAWKRLKQRVGIEDLRFHDLRHEAVSRFFEMGLSVPEVALISGHRDPRMLFRYTHLKPEQVRDKIRAQAV